jgi:putative ABC transport system ATP-binding protein
MRAGRSSIVIADEPTAELDSASADRVLGAFAVLAGEQVAFVLSSHDPQVVERSDHLLRLERGRPVESW